MESFVDFWQDSSTDQRIWCKVHARVEGFGVDPSFLATFETDPAEVNREHGRTVQQLVTQGVVTRVLGVDDFLKKSMKRKHVKMNLYVSLITS